ncbi:MAG: dienelactone hydrolase family protein [Verrucomicrobium sp.]
MALPAQIFTLLGLCLSLVSVSCQSVAASPGVKVTAHKFQSGGKTIRVDRFRPANVAHGATAPSAVVVLHGAGGTVLDGPEMKRTALELAKAGHDAYVLHYFNRTGNWIALDDGMTRNFAAWHGTVGDAVKWVRISEGQRGPIGIFGYSLGGFLTVAEAFHDPDISAAVVHAGGIWNGYDRNITNVPPMLLVHGTLDKRVEYSRYMPPLQKLLKSKGVPAETAFYEGQDHRFDKPSLMNVRQQTVSFFSKHLRSS